MIWIIARRQVLDYLITWRFGLVLCVVAVTPDTLAVTQDYRSRREAYQQGVQQYEEQLKAQGTCGRLAYELKTFREPRRLAVFRVCSVSHQSVPPEVIPVFAEDLSARATLAATVPDLLLLGAHLTLLRSDVA